jgi:hypothetical protein
VETPNFRALVATDNLANDPRLCVVRFAQVFDANTVPVERFDLNAKAERHFYDVVEFHMLASFVRTSLGAALRRFHVNKMFSLQLTKVGYHLLMRKTLGIDIDELVEQYNRTKKSKWQDRKAVTLYFQPPVKEKFDKKQADSGNQFGKLVTEVVRILIERDDIAC